MDDKLVRAKVHTAVQQHCHASGVQPNPFLAQRVLAAAQEKGDKAVTKKFSIGFILVIILLLITLTAVAVELLSGRQVVEQVAVPIAQKNDQKNYSHEELTQLLAALNENGITLDEGSILMQAFQAGKGYWERDVIQAICISAFGGPENAWSIEQKHWYGEMLLAIGAWNQNLWLLPGEGDMTVEEARAHGVRALKNAFQTDLPLDSNEYWLIQEVYELVWDEETDAFPAEKAQWCFWYTNRSTDRMEYSVTLSRDGQIIDIWRNSSAPQAENHSSSTIVPLYEKEAVAIEMYGSVMHYWPNEVKIKVYGTPYTIPSQAAYAQALAIAEKSIADSFGPEALTQLGDYKIGLMHQAIKDEEKGVTQLHWDFMFTTDTQFLSDGYRVQFRQTINEQSGEILTYELCVETANIGNG
ncbi:MAG: hypothetical protein E7324_04620 [Clostridiales bacterium]|nr:hypothetical protein [Clostridiales bacterium]